MEDLDILKNTIESITNKLFVAKTLVNTYSLKNTTAIKNLIEQYDFFSLFKDSLDNFRYSLSKNYLKNVQTILLQYHENLHFIPPSEITPDQSHFVNQVLYFTEQNFGGFEEYIHFNEIFNNIAFTLNFFEQLNYLTQNMVLLGANGSGKSSLAFNLKCSLGKYSLIISAQKLLLIPEFDSISNTNNTKSLLLNQQENINHHRYTYQANEHIPSLPFIQEMANYFKNIINNLLAEKAESNHLFIESLKSQGETIIQNIPETTLDKVLKVWNSIFIHRTLFFSHLNLKVNDTILNQEYSTNLMSDGEKAGLFYISLILQAPMNSLIIVDEPEMYLHKTILNKMWDSLEALRSDCIFLYLTHDVEFATARYNSKKYWLSNYRYPNKWDINEIESLDELPEHLLLELVGSRKNILFCEGEVGQSDDEIYKIIFPNFTIKPVGSCSNVINYTRAFNKINNKTTNAFGLIDSDYSPTDRLQILADDMIFSLGVAEIENLLLEEELLKIVVENSPIDYTPSVIDKIKEIFFAALEGDIESQAASFVSAEIDFYFKESHLKEGKTKHSIETNFQTFLSTIQIEEKYNRRLGELKEIIEKNNYLDVLRNYNNKGLSSKIHNLLEIKSYKKLAIKQLRINKEARKCLEKHFPTILLEKGC
ncbi:DUF4435 domain-containing protein [Acinetobacter baumannii]|uniref:DUF4435 domain-containing protein n=1 Tax=Acinetobacter baumannii TaxID=470 RepID=UPI0013A66C08|nr:DUF4435 domain-containing protein [Acinetobacter baumannii]